MHQHDGIGVVQGLDSGLHASVEPFVGLDAAVVVADRDAVLLALPLPLAASVTVALWLPLLLLKFCGLRTELRQHFRIRQFDSVLSVL